MKKITFLIFALISTFTFAQVGISENFDSGTPAGWTDSYANTGITPCAGNSERDNLWSSSTTGNLTSPNLVGASNGTDLTVSFDYKIIDYTGGGATAAGWGTAELQYSTDDGATWNTVLTIDDGNHVASVDCANMSVVIPAASLPSSSDVKLQIANVWLAGDYYFYVDNFNATQIVNDPPNCDSTLSETADVSIAGDISWSVATGIPTGYNVTVGTSTGTSDVLATTDVGNVTSYNLGVLTYSTTYYVTIEPYNANGAATGCTEQTFVTEDIPPAGTDCFNPIVATVESDCATATPYTIEYDSAADLGTTDLSCDTFGVNTGAWFSFVAPASGAVNVSFTDTNEYALFDACGGTEIECNGTASNLAELTGLTPSNTYYLAVWKDSATTGTTDVCFQEITCSNPSAMTESNVTSNSADLAWTPGGGESDWNLEWVAGADFTPGNMEEDGSASVTGTSTHGLSSLTANTTYYVYYQASCGAGGTSDWIGPFTFTTACEAFVPDYTESFDTFVPSCWNEAGSGTPATGPSDLGSGLWGAAGWLNAGSTGATKINLYTNNREDWILSPSFDLSAGGYELVYSVGLTDYNNSNAPEGAGMGSDDEVQVLVTTDGGTTWTSLRTYNQADYPSHLGEQETISLTAYDGMTVQFGIWATDGTVNDTEDYDFFFDEFIVRTPLACTTAVVDSSTIAEDCGNSQFYVDIDITTVGDATQINDGTNTYAISGTGVLQVGPFASGATVTLDVEHSDVACDFSLGDFTYTCPPANDDVCNAIALTVGATSAGDAYTSTGATAQTGEVEGSCFNGGIDTSVWFTFVAPAGGDVTVTTDIMGGTFDDTEVAVYEAPSDCSDASTLGTEVGCDQDGGTDVNFNSVVNLTGLVEGATYYVQVDRWGGSAGGTFGIEVIDNTLSTNSFELNGFEYFPNPVNDKLTLRAQNNIQNVSVYNMLGQEVVRVSPNVIDTQVDMSELQVGTYFVKVTINNTTKTIKILKK